MPKVRIFEVVQYEFNPRTGEDLNFNEDNIISAVAHKTIKDWAYIRHDKDKNTAEDEANGVGEINFDRPAHWHCVCRCNCPIDLPTIARWFGVPQNCIEIPQGRGAFVDKIEYLTHENPKQQAKGKHLYGDDEVKANFDFRALINGKQERILKYGRDLSERDALRYEVLFNGMSLRQIATENPLAYQEDFKMLDVLRGKYLTMFAPMPKTRLNYYVCGEGGVGKGVICRALARSLYPHLESDDDIFFEVGAKGAAFEGYDGQPVIIWNDRRAFDLLTELNGRGNVFNVFDTHPTRQKQNVKYKSVCLVNEVNIVNSVQPYQEFLSGLAGEYKTKDGEVIKSEDKKQSFRRFPFIIPLHEEDFDLLMNKGFYNGTKEYEQYIEYKHIRGNMAKISEICGANEVLARKLENQTVKPIADKHNELIEVVGKRSTATEEEIEKMFSDYGTSSEPPTVREIENLKNDDLDEKEKSEQLAFEDFEDVEISEEDLPFDYPEK